MLRDEPVEITGLKAGIIGLGVSGKMIADALQFMGADIAYYSRTRKPDAEAVGMAYKPLAQLLTESEVVFTCLNKNVLLLGKDEFAQLGAGKVLFNTSIGQGYVLVSPFQNALAAARIASRSSPNASMRLSTQRGISAPQASEKRRSWLKFAIGMIPGTIGTPIPAATQASRKRRKS